MVFEDELGLGGLIFAKIELRRVRALWNRPEKENMKRDLPTAASILRKEECVLVILDAQEKLLTAAANRGATTANLVRLARFSQIMELPVVVTEHDKMGPTLEAISGQLSPSLEPIGKKTYDATETMGFEKAVWTHKRQYIVIAGLEAHAAVMQTAMSCLANYLVHVVGDAVDSRQAHNRDLALERMRQAGVIITSTEMFIYELLRESGNAPYRATLPLIK